jgi:hypothetical protein
MNQTFNRAELEDTFIAKSPLDAWNQLLLTDANVLSILNIRTRDFTSHDHHNTSHMQIQRYIAKATEGDDPLNFR